MISKKAEIEDLAVLGENILVEDYSVIKNGAKIGTNTKIHVNVLIDNDVSIGSNVKIQNNVVIPHGVTIEDGVFVGPGVNFTNDKWPRSITPQGKLKSNADWHVSETLVRYGASIGAGSTIVCGITIGRWAMIGAGSVVVKSVPDFAIVCGNPAAIVGYTNENGEKKS